MTQFFSRIAATCLLGVAGLYGAEPMNPAATLLDVANFGQQIALEEMHFCAQGFDAEQLEQNYAQELELEESYAEEYDQDIKCLKTRSAWMADTYEFNGEQFQVAFPTKPMDLSGDSSFILIAEGNSSVHAFVALPHNGTANRIIGNEDSFIQDILSEMEAYQTLVSCSFHMEGDVEIADLVVYDSQNNVYSKMRVGLSWANAYFLTTGYPAGQADEHHLFADSFVVLP